ncbi:dihydrolipoyl dehydrogenase [Bacillus sp. AFS031507]|uniref:dihydrolipoyl dehydrogenase n=1 Tax=Bacillus sp. AFS031507 TaxID=2033496 RepID=UPI000BFD7E19|nr:dihydrolipoyl dehydrogenase [Bacillus sp. AFS031507]PGY15287.1 dihydrolipoyl dehydrogenase [Bacillus sp. AFS031507]
MKMYDLIVVGGGPGGYVAADYAGKLGLSVALIENQYLGGTCLNSGCIPSKTLLRHSEFLDLLEKAKKWGIEVENVHLSFEKMMKRKTTVIENLRKGVESLLKSAKVDLYNGLATVLPDYRVNIESNGIQSEVYGKKIIIATGSKPYIPPIKGVEHIQAHTSDTIFDLTNIPKSIVIIGGGIIGVEFACIFSSLNVEVTIIEMGERLIAGEDEDASRLMTKELKKKGITIHTSAKVVEAGEIDSEKAITVELKNLERVTVLAEEVLFASGRNPNVSCVNKLGLKMNGPFIAVNKQMETSFPNVYAVGDVIGGWQLAHVASSEGIVAASNASGIFKEVDYKVVPRCIYTFPEIASVGLSEKEAKERGYSYRSETLQLRANGKTLAMDESSGFIKLIADDRYGEILGAVMVGPHVTEMISEVSTAIFLEGTMGELASLIHPHPTVTEGIWETARAWLEKKKSLVIH